MDPPKLLIVSGKGGVGKTTLSAALALSLAKQKKKVLLAEIQSQDQVAHLFGRSPFGPEETPLLPNLQAINISPKKAFEEYVLSQIKYRSLYTAVFENRFVRYFLDATPGLSELMSLGKIYSLVSRYDCVVVDAPATGHGVSLLQVPGIVASAVRVGPLKENAEKIAGLLQDPEQTLLCLVTLPEEMPIKETIEMASLSREKLKIPLGPVFINGVVDPLFSGKEESLFESWSDPISKKSPLYPLVAAARVRQKKASLVQEACEELKKELPRASFIRLPFLFSDSFGLKEIRELSRWVEKGDQP